MALVSLTRKCPICDNAEADLVDRVKFICENENRLPSEYTIVVCKKCGFAFSDMNGSQKLFDEYYSNMNIYSEAENLRGVIDSDSPYLRKIHDVLAERIDNSARIIDIGCGGGQLLEYLKNRGYSNLFGLDPSEASIKRLKQIEIEGSVGSIFDNIDRDLKAHFDVVISTMVAEHIYDLDLYVRQLIEYLKDSGFIFVTVPAVEGFSDYVCDKPNYFNQEHINYFSSNSIQNLFGKYGLWLTNWNYFLEGEKEKCLYLMFQKKKDERPLLKDEISKNKIESYLFQYSKKQQAICEKVNYILKSSKKVVFWGSGQYAKQILCGYPEIIERIAYFVDNNTTRWGIKLAGKNIVPPKTLYSDRNDVVICICSMKNSLDIKKQISENCNLETIIL